MRYLAIGSTLKQYRTKPLIKCTPEEADEILTGCAEQVEAINEMLADLEGRFTQIVEPYEWESFTPEQRSLLKRWHVGCQNSKHVLHSPNGI